MRNAPGLLFLAAIVLSACGGTAVDEGEAEAEAESEAEANTDAGLPVVCPLLEQRDDSCVCDDCEWGSADDWQQDDIWIAGGMNSYMGFALAGGNPHLVVALGESSGETYRLGHVWLSDGVWQGEGVDDSGNFRNPSLVIDADSTLHVFMHDIVNGGLWHAERATAGWTSEIVDEDPARGELNAAAISATGTLHVVYTAIEGDQPVDLLHASRAIGKAWSIESLSVAGTFPSLAANGDELALAFAMAVGDGVFSIAFGRREATGWSFDDVDTESGQSGGVALGLDPAGEPHIVYGRDEQPFLAEKCDAGWHIETVGFTDGDTGRIPSMVVDPWGGIHATWGIFDPSTGDNGERYAYRPAGGMWSLMDLDDPIDWCGGKGGGYHHPLLVGADGAVHAMCTDGGGLTYARRAGSCP